MKQISFSSRQNTVFGYLHVPEGNIPAPTIVMCHGFCGNAAESSRLFVDFALEAVQRGYCVIRYDCLGSGNSELDFSEYTYISGWVEDMTAAVSFAAAQPEVDSSRIATLGISMGGATSILTGKDTRVHAVAAWSPAINAEFVFKQILGTDVWERLEKGNDVYKGEFFGTRYAVSSRMVRDIKSLRISSALDAYGKKPLFILQGLDDQVIDVESAQKLSDAYPDNVELLYVEGEDHDLTRKSYSDYEHTLNYFDRVLK